MLYSRGFAQGDAVYAEITGISGIPVSVELTFNGRTIPSSQRKWGFRSFFCVPPEMDEGITAAVVKCKMADHESSLEIPFSVGSGQFKVDTSALDLGPYSDYVSKNSPELQACIDRCSEKKKTAFAEMINDRFSSNLAHPRDMHYITSEFYSKRVIAQYRIENGKRVHLKDDIKIHWGTDFRGAEGTPVYAMATGHVALSGLMYYEGNMIILDHGNGIFTYYMHMSGRKVKEGDDVIAGEKIGVVGSTGMATGPHLHVSLLMNKEHADPLSLLCLPIRD
jgi:murein DD-endopeptidase MepM/ murein hydrolase activator NlpD